jgi:diguanylate cyclase (GGDEF)-like protein
MPLPTTLAFGLLSIWVVAIIAATRGLVLPALGGAGLVLLAVLMLVVRRHHLRLQHLAATDALTGLTNHRGFHEVLAAELGRARRERTSVAMVTLDLDNFKTVNDTHGHPFGDEVLRAVGTRLSGVVRDTDTAARVGGEEFALILPRTDGDLAYRIAERARAAVATVPVRGLELSCSAGLATYPGDAEEASTLCQLADGALYWAKRHGKRRTRRFDRDHMPLAWTDQQTAEIEAMLALANPIESVFQPIVALATGRMVGFEALARFPSSPRRSPEVWFAQAHGCGLGAELEAVAIRAAFEPLGRPPGAYLALNISPSALSSKAVATALPDDLTDLVIEITEHEFVPHDEALANIVAELRERGARIAIDDAGAGYAGLKQMMRVRPDIVKLDRDLTDGIHTDPARMALVESFVRFAGRIGATVCAEGIESLEDMATLADLDVEWGQGYALARPAPPWAEVSSVAAGSCRSALLQALRAGSTSGAMVAAGDRRLEHLSARLAGARSRHDLDGALALIAEELNAEKVCLSQWHADEGIIETLAENGETSGETQFAVTDYPLTERVLHTQEAVEVQIGDPTAEPGEVDLLLVLGHRSLLMMPVICRGESVGIVEAYRNDDRSWTRAEINRARIICNQFGSVIEGSFISAPGEHGAGRPTL